MYKFYIEFFENPSRKELASAGNKPLKDYIRFLADSETEKLYIWNSYMLHIDAYRILGDIKNQYTRPGAASPTLFAGTAGKQRSGNWILTEATSFKNKKPREWVWLNKYIKTVRLSPCKFICN